MLKTCSHPSPEIHSPHNLQVLHIQGPLLVHHTVAGRIVSPWVFALVVVEWEDFRRAVAFRTAVEEVQMHKEAVNRMEHLGSERWRTEGLGVLRMAQRKEVGQWRKEERQPC